MYIIIILKTYLLVYMSNIKQGVGCFIHPSVQIMDGANVTLGDHVYIGENVKIMPGEFSIGDYSKIHPQKSLCLGPLLCQRIPLYRSHWCRSVGRCLCSRSSWALQSDREIRIYSV